MIWRSHIALAIIFSACAGVPLPGDLKQAQDLESAGHPEEALTLYRKTTADCRAPGARPKDDCGLAAFRSAQLLEELARYPDAVAAFQKVRELSLDGRLISRSLQRAALLWADKLERPDLAVTLCRQVVIRWPDEVSAEDALRLWSQLWRNEPEWPAELDRLARDLTPHEISGFALLYRAERAERDGDTDTAVARYDELWHRFPHGPLRDDAAIRSARLLRAKGRPQEAALRLEQLERTYTRSWLLGHYNTLLMDDGALLLGHIYLEDLHQPRQAIAALARLLKRQPTSELCDDALLLMAQASNMSEACRYLQRLFRDYPKASVMRQAQATAALLGCR